MGLENALALEKLGIKGAEVLARRNPEELFVQLRALRPDVRLEEVKVWIREARRKQEGNGLAGQRADWIELFDQARTLAKRSGQTARKRDLPALRGKKPGRIDAVYYIFFASQVVVPVCVTPKHWSARKYSACYLAQMCHACSSLDDCSNPLWEFSK